MNLKMIAKVIAALLLSAFLLCTAAFPATTQSIPVVISGYVTVNGVATNGVQVSSGGASYTTKSDSGGHPGYYIIMPGGVANGSSVKVNFNYGGHSTSVTVKASGASVTAPTANIASGSNTGSSGSSGSTGNTATTTATITATPAVTATVQPTTAQQAATATPTATPAPVVSSTAFPTPAPEQDGNVVIYVIIGLIAGLALASAGFLVFMRKR